MTRHRLKALFLYLICTVVLAVQWVPAHAHLDAAHQHDGSKHEHHATIHAHQSVIEHGGALDSSPIEQHLEAVVDIDQSYCAGSPLRDHDFTGSIAVQPPTPSGSQDRFRPLFGSAMPNRPPPHVGEPRAPPQHA